MRKLWIHGWIAALMLPVAGTTMSCSRDGGQNTTEEDAELAAKGSVEVTAELLYC